MFARHGIPTTLLSDNGPQFSSKEFQDFTTAYCFQHVTSRPHSPQANGLAEHTVRTVKKLLQGSKDLFLALLSYRTTPLHMHDTTFLKTQIFCFSMGLFNYI